MNEKIYRYYVHTIAGLEEVVMEDVRQSLGEVENLHLERGQRQGRVLFSYRRTPRRLADLRSVISAYGLLADVRGVTVGQPGLQRVCQALARIPLDAARSLVRACDPGVAGTAFRVNATVKGSHRFTGRELTVAAAEVFSRVHGLEPASQGRALHFQVQVTGTRAVIGIQAGARRAPGSPRRDGVGAPLAYCLVRMMGIKAGDRVLAASCSAAGAAEIAEATGATVICTQWSGQGGPAPRPDGCSGEQVAGLVAGLVAGPGYLPVADGAASASLAVVGNGPQDRAAAGFDVMPELARILEVGGVAAVLAADPRAFVPRLKGAGLPFEILTGLPIGVGGRLYGLYMLERSRLSLLQL